MVTSDNNAISRLLAGSELFSSLSTDALNDLALHAVIRAIPEKEVIFAKGAPGTDLFAILQGRVKISSFSEDGKEIIFTILESGNFFGETALLDGQNRSATCTAIEDCQMVVIERDSFTSYLEKYPTFAIHLLSLLSQRLRNKDEQMEEISFFQLPARLARKLLALAEEHGDVVGSKIEIAMNISQHELANMVCVSRESVNKQLSQWVKDGLISLSSRLIVIEDRDRLLDIGRKIDNQK
jgi:CRP/FNR family cyclic AMP-dependent transcriptional regulator